MLCVTLWSALSLLPGQVSAPPALPSLAVLELQHKQGVSADVAALLTSHMAARLRASRRFSRIVSAQEIETMLGFERQKQLMECDSSSCMSEVTGALGVDYLASGAVGKLGDRFLITVSLIRAQTARTEASISKPVLTANEGDLLASMEGIVVELLVEANLSPGGSLPAARPAVTPAPPLRQADSSSASGTPEPPTEVGLPRSTRSKVMLGAGGVLVALCVPALLLMGALLGGAVLDAAGAQTVLFNKRLIQVGVGPALFPAFIGLVAAGGALMLFSLGAAGAGAAVLGAGVVWR